MKNGFSGLNNLYLTDSLGIQFTGRSSNPTDSDLAAGRIYYDSVALAFKFYNGSTWTTIGSGSGGIPSWETIFANDATFGITSGTWTITQSSANAIITLNKTNVGAGAVLNITNAGSGADIKNGTSWSIAAAGGVGVLNLGSTGSINATDGALTIGKTLTATTFLGTVAIAEAVTLTTSLAVGTSATVATTLTVGTNFTMTLGVATLIGNSNTAPTVLMTNNTATTYGVGGTSTGVALFRSTSLTSGTLVRAQLTEATLNGGFYFDAWDVTAGAAVFSIAEDGNVVIAGTANGTAALTLTVGDVVISDGKISHTSTASGAGGGYTLTANSMLAQTVLAVAGSGAFTGSTTTSFMTLTPSGLTTGTALYIPVAALTTGKVLHTVANAMTTGGVITASSTSAVLTSGYFASYTWNPASYTGAAITSAGLVRIADNPTISTSVTGSHNDLNVTRTNVTAAAAITYTVTGSIVKIINASPTIGAASTLTDSASVLELANLSTTSTGKVLEITDLKAAGTGNISLSIAANSLTTSTGAFTLSTTGMTSGSTMKLTGGGANLTTGKVLEIAMGAAVTGQGLSLVTSGVFTDTAGVVAVTANSLTTGTGLELSFTGLTSGKGIEVLGGGANMTTGSLVSVSMGAGTAGTAYSAFTSGVYTGTGISKVIANGLTSGVALSLSTTGITTGNALAIDLGTGVYTGTGAISITGSGATSGVVMLVSNSGVMTGNGQIAQFTAAGASDATKVFGITANAATSSALLSVSGTGLTSGVGVKVTATAATMTTGAYFQANDGGVNVFAVGLNGHLQSRQTTKPTIAVSQQNGITAAAITNGSTDTCGIVTTTGTNNNGGTSIIVVTFGKAYAIAPTVILSGANASGSLIWPFVSATTTTTFTITVPASASSGATPSWYYQVIEMGS